jgi:hypothetical protein
MDKGLLDRFKRRMRLRFALKKNPKMGALTTTRTTSQKRRQKALLWRLEEEEEEEKGVVVPRGIMVLLARALLKKGGVLRSTRRAFYIVRALCVLFLLRNARIFLVGIKSQRGCWGVF